MKLVMAAEKPFRPDAGRNACNADGLIGLAAFEETGARHWQGHTEIYPRATHAYSRPLEIASVPTAPGSVWQHMAAAHAASPQTGHPHDGAPSIPNMKTTVSAFMAAINADALQENIYA